MGSVLQAVLSFWNGLSMKKRRCMLDPALQSFVVSQWKRVGSTHLFSPGLLDLLGDFGWIKRHSKGTYTENALFDEWFFPARASESKRQIA